MRTALSIDNDVLDRARKIATELRRPFRSIVNEALRAGLDRMEVPSTAAPLQNRTACNGPPLRSESG